MEALLQFVPEPQRAKARAAAQRFIVEHGEWCRALLGASGDVLAPNVALTVTAIAPHLPYADVRLLIRFALWLYLLDDHQDEPTIRPAELRALETGTNEVLDGAPGEGGFLAELAEQRAVFEARDRGGLVFVRLIEAVRVGLAAGVEHALLSRRVAQGAAYAPSVEEYLELAVHHVNYGCFALLLVLLVGARLGEKELDVVEAALTSGNLAVRLANDLRSQDRERAEGSLNVMGLCISGLAPVRDESVRHRIRQAALEHDTLLEPLPAEVRDVLVRSLRVSVAAYGISDLR